MLVEINDYLTIQEYCELKNLKYSLVARMLREHRLEHIRKGNMYLIHKDAEIEKIKK